VIETKSTAEKIGLPNADKEPLTPLERKINYIQKGGLIDKLYAWVSGESKSLKKLRKLYEEERREVDIQLDIQMIRNHFTDEYFIKTIGIPEQKIDAFIRFCLKDKLVFYFERNRELDMMNLFIKNKIPFEKEMEKSGIPEKKL
jgi:hypothetical protein